MKRPCLPLPRAEGGAAAFLDTPSPASQARSLHRATGYRATLNFATLHFAALYCTTLLLAGPGLATAHAAAASLAAGGTGGRVPADQLQADQLKADQNLADPSPADRHLADWVPVAEDVLADARGGFDTGNGLLVSLSVDRMLSLNGNVIASGQLSMDASALAGPAGLSTLQIARIGEGRARVDTAQPLAGLVLQNSANDQLIRSQTTIDATVNSLSILKDMHFGDSLRHSLSTAIQPR